MSDTVPVLKEMACLVGEREAGTEMTAQNNRCYDWTVHGVSAAQRMHPPMWGVSGKLLFVGDGDSPHKFYS